MSEHLKYLGRRAQLELERKSLEIKISGLIQILRDELDPLKDILRLKAADIVTHALSLADETDRYKRVGEDLDRIREIIGR